MDAETGIHVSRDGAWCIFAGRGAGRDDRGIYARTLPGGEGPRILIETSAFETQPRLSPDGSLLALVSDKSGQREVYVLPMADAGAGAAAALIRVSRTGGTQPRWSHDGHRLYFFDYPNWSVMVAELQWDDDEPTFGEPDFLLDMESVGSHIITSSVGVPDGDRLLIATEAESPPEVLPGQGIRMVLNWMQEGTLFEDP